MAAVRLRAAAPGSARPRLRAQLLPCRVGRRGPAPVAAFLRARPGPGGELWASFRGRRLGGRELPLPHGFQGVLLGEGQPHDHAPEPQERWATVTGTFDVITEWGADALPSPAGGLGLALQWGPLACAIHAPVGDVSDEEAEP